MFLLMDDRLWAICHPLLFWGALCSANTRAHHINKLFFLHPSTATNYVSCHLQFELSSSISVLRNRETHCKKLSLKSVGFSKKSNHSSPTPTGLDQELTLVSTHIAEFLEGLKPMQENKFIIVVLIGFID